MMSEDEKMPENFRELWKYEIREAKKIRRQKRTNAFSYFTLGFCMATLMVEIIILLSK